MKKTLSLLIISSLVVFSGYASDIEEHEHEKSDFYIATKAMVTLGSVIAEEKSTLDGGIGEGLAVDIGYKVGNGFAIEIDGTYAEDMIIETKPNEEPSNIAASYITTSLDVSYTYHPTHEIAVFVKGGFEYEFEKIDALSVDAINTGFIYATGTEYEISETMAFIGEYEVTTIKGPRGNSIFAGMVYSF